MKQHLIDGVVGFAGGFVLFLGLPLVVFHGNWGLVGYDTVQSLFPSLASSPQGTLMALCLVYVLFDCLLFLIYREFPSYKARHAPGIESFLFALGSFLVGAILGYGAVLLVALSAFGAAGGAAL